ncbi:phospholipase D-like domain-containing protein, partial [Profundibacterium mesophilum]|uniref:phospholipase D-like domain-containing protein n=1 Tax=Profundibacterium mesophilum TaxID=1258573 RepID=UPI0034DD63CA
MPAGENRDRREGRISDAPYLLPDRTLRDSLIAAARRGVKVRIVMPAHSDHPPLDALGRRFAHALAAQMDVDVASSDRHFRPSAIRVCAGKRGISQLPDPVILAGVVERGSRRTSPSVACGRCCRTLIVEDSHCESMRLDGPHEQAIT